MTTKLPIWLCAVLLGWIAWSVTPWHKKAVAVPPLPVVPTTNKEIVLAGSNVTFLTGYVCRETGELRALMEDVLHEIRAHHSNTLWQQSVHDSRVQAFMRDQAQASTMPHAIEGRMRALEAYQKGLIDEVHQFREDQQQKDQKP